MSLMDLLGVNSWDGVTAHLRENLLTNTRELGRQSDARMRQAFWEGKGQEYIRQRLKKWFSDPEARALREAFIDDANYINVLGRVADEKATLYQRPPTRKVKVAANNERYQEFLRRSRHDQYMAILNQYLAGVHKQVLVGFRVWEDETGQRHPQIHLVTPDQFYVVTHPSDPLRVIAFIIDQEPHLSESSLPWNPLEASRPRYVVWTNTEFFRLTRGGYMINGPTPHPGPRMPWLLASAEPTISAALATGENADLAAAHRAIWFLNILQLKESKSSNKQTAFTGDISGTPTGQSQDTEVDLILGDGVTTQTIDRSVDLGSYRQVADHILERTAANHGIPPSVLRNDGATSGFEIELRRIGIRERRRKQEPVFRDFEREFAQLQAMVLERDMPDLAFQTNGWGINFSEPETPLNAMDRLQVFETERRLGLSNTLVQIMERDPDLSLGDAIDVLLDNIMIETFRNQQMRPLQQIGGSMGAATPGTNSFETNRGESRDDATQAVTAAQVTAA